MTLNRYGPTSLVTLTWMADCLRFENFAPEYAA